MKAIFHRRRVKEEKTTTHVIYVQGFTDDTGNIKAEIVISAITGSHSALAAKDSKRLCDALNKAWLNFYEGDYTPPPAKIKKVTSLGNLRALAMEDDRYLQLAIDAANTLGGGIKKGDLAAAMKWLILNANETNDEQGVVDEVNDCRP